MLPAEIITASEVVIPAQVVIAIRMNAFLVILKSYRSMGQAKLKLEGVE